MAAFVPSSFFSPGSYGYSSFTSFRSTCPVSPCRAAGGSRVNNVRRARAPGRARVHPSMAVSVKKESLPNSQVKLEISVGREESQAAWDKVLKRVMKEVRIDGFRKGRAPQQLVINVVGRDKLKLEACGELLQTSVREALEEAEVRAIGQAQLAEGQGVHELSAGYEPGSGLSFRVTVDVWPEARFTGPYESLAVTAEEVPLDETLVERSLQELRKREAFTVLAPEGAVAKMGMVAVGELVGYYRKEDGSKGERLPDIADGNNIPITLKENQYMAGFAEGIVGMKVGETRTIPVQFPEQSARAELRGVNALFDVTINALKDEVLPELNDEFARDHTESETLEDLKKVIRERVGSQSREATTSNVERAIEDALVAITETEIPETLIESRVKDKFASMMSEFKSNGMPDEQVKKMITRENYEKYKKHATKNVVRALTVSLAFSKIASEEGLKYESREVEDQMEVLRGELKGQEIDETRLREHVEAQLEREKVLTFLKTTSKITMIPKKEEEEPEPAVEKEAVVS